MKWLLAIAFAVVGLVLAAVVASKWSYATNVVSTPVVWRDAPLDVTWQQLEFAWDTIEFVDAQNGRHRFVALRQGSRTATFHDVSHFRGVERSRGRVWALAESSLHALVFRSDDAVNYELWKLTSLNEQAVIASWEVEGDVVDIHYTLNHQPHPDDIFWWEPIVMRLPSLLRPLAYADGFTFRTRDAGRTWRVSR